MYCLLTYLVIWHQEVPTKPYQSKLLHNNQQTNPNQLLLSGTKTNLNALLIFALWRSLLRMQEPILFSFQPILLLSPKRAVNRSIKILWFSWKQESFSVIMLPLNSETEETAREINCLILQTSRPEEIGILLLFAIRSGP